MIKLYIIESVNPSNAFDMNDISGYKDTFSDSNKMGNSLLRDYYKFEKGKDAKITYMTGEDYIDKCCKYIFKKPRTNVVDASVDFNKVNEYAEMMKNGTTFQGTYLDYTSPTQEGRHRALAFTKAFGDNAKMPVLEIFPTDVTDDEIYDYCQRRWGNGDEWFPYVTYKLGRTEKEVCDYLGIPYNETQPNEDELGDEEDTINDTDIDFNISDEDILDDEYELDAFEEFVREQSNGKIQDISDLDVDEFMKWMCKFTRYYS